MDPGSQLFRLFVLALPIAWAAWTVTHEEIFREFKEYCVARSKTCAWLGHRKFFYVFTCEYCFSHWVALVCELIFGFKMVFEDWRGYLVAFPALVWTANLYMNLYQRIRVDIRKGKAEADHAEEKAEAPPHRRSAA